jgi:hypothetical protein
MKYCKNMTGLLEEALRRVESLPSDEQDAIAAQILLALDDDDEAWERSFRENPDAVRALAKEAIEKHRRGETRPLDEILG